MTIRRALAAVVGAAVFAAPAPALAAVDLSSYVRIERHDLPAVAAEASAVTYNGATDSLFIVGDEATSVLQVSKTGALIDSMTLAPGAFDDTEGITSIGGGQFVLAEERVRQLNRFTYAPGTTLTRAQVQSAKLGTTIGNEGFEGLANDPFSGGFVVVKEINPQGVFQTTVDWAAGTASNGSPTTVNSTNLFDPARPEPARHRRRVRAGRRPAADPQPGVGQARQRDPHRHRHQLARPSAPRPKATRA